MSKNPDFEHESRVVYKALCRMTEDFSLLQTSYQYWFAQFSHEALDPIGFSEGLRSYVGLSDNHKRTLLISMHAYIGLSLQDLKPVPASLLNAAIPNRGGFDTDEPSKQEFTQANTAQWVIADSFMKSLVAMIKKVDPNAFQEFQEIILEDDLEISSTNTISTLKSWAASGFTKLDLAKDIEPKECSECAHFLYLMSCEVLGPPKADVVLDRLIRQLSELPEALSFDPKGLL